MGDVKEPYVCPCGSRSCANTRNPLGPMGANGAVRPAEAALILEKHWPEWWMLGSEQDRGYWAGGSKATVCIEVTGRDNRPTLWEIATTHHETFWNLCKEHGLTMRVVEDPTRK